MRRSSTADLSTPAHGIRAKAGTKHERLNESFWRSATSTDPELVALNDDVRTPIDATLTAGHDNPGGQNKG